MHSTVMVAEECKRHNVPLVVDAAAEVLTLKPNVHLQRGATVMDQIFSDNR